MGGPRRAEPHPSRSPPTSNQREHWEQWERLPETQAGRWFPVDMIVPTLSQLSGNSGNIPLPSSVACANWREAFLPPDSVRKGLTWVRGSAHHSAVT